MALGTEYKNWQGFEDVKEGISDIQLPLLLAKSEIKRRYRRSTLGPFWITISTAVTITTIGFIFGKIFKSPLSEFLPFIAAGLILWNFISSTISDSCDVFVQSEASIKQLPLPLFTYVEQLVIRNFYIFLHNIVIFPVVCFVTGRALGLNCFLSIPGIILVLLNLSWVSLALGIVCTRYRDLAQIVKSILQILFYVTPIIWMPNQVSARVASIFIELNPIYHILSNVRAPLMNNQPSMLNWIVSILVAVLGWAVTIILFNHYKKRIAYWL